MLMNISSIAMTNTSRLLKTQQLGSSCFISYGFAKKNAEVMTAKSCGGRRKTVATGISPQPMGQRFIVRSVVSP